MSELPEGWVEAPLMDVIDLKDARRVPLNKSQREARPGKVPYYGANGLVDHVDDYLFEGRHMLLAEDGGNFDAPHKGVAYLVDGKFWVNNHAHVIGALGDMKVDYLAHWANSFDWMPYVGGTTRLKLSQEGMKRVSIPLAPLEEQNRIVAKIDSLTAKSARAQTELAKIEALVERYKAAVLERAFGAFNEFVSLDDLIQNIKAGKNLKCVERPPLDGEKGVVKVSAVTWGEFDPEQSKTLPDNHIPDPDTLIKSGDFLFSRANTFELVGAAVIVGNAPHNLYLSDKILRIDFKFDVSAWVLWYFRSPMGRRALEAASSGNQLSMRNISQKKLRDIPVPMPSASVRAKALSRIVRQLSAYREFEAEVRTALGFLNRLHQAVLEKAFRGELVPQDPSDEPAERLLERIVSDRSRRKVLVPNRLLEERQRNTMVQHTAPKRGAAHPEDYLASLLRQDPDISNETLWKRSGLDIEDFFRQARKEAALGFLPPIRLENGATP